jgi:ankyrin repeat protein
MDPHSIVTEIDAMWSRVFDVSESQWKRAEMMENILRSPKHLLGSVHGYSLLHAIIEHGATGDQTREAKIDEMAVALLLEKGMDIDGKCKSEFSDKCTALHLAAKLNKPALVKLLVIHGADVDARNEKHQMTALGMNIQFGNGDLEILKLLLAHGGTEPATALQLALQFKQREIVEYLLGRGGDIVDDNGDTLLIKAAGGGKLEDARLLLESKANHTLKNNNGVTALAAAVNGGLPEMVRLFLDHKADVQVQDNDGTTVLMAAVRNVSEEIVNLLLDNGSVATIDVKDKNGVTPLMAVALNGSEDIAKELLKHNPTLEGDLYPAKIPQNVAVEKGHLKLARLLENARRPSKSKLSKLRPDRTTRELLAAERQAAEMQRRSSSGTTNQAAEGGQGRGRRILRSMTVAVLGDGTGSGSSVSQDPELWELYR